MSEYTESFKDPRWQKKRLRIYERDEFACKNCGSSTEELNAHHLYYEKGLKPWEYPDKAIVTMCNDCHEKWHSLKLELDKKNGYSLKNFEFMMGFAGKISNDKFNTEIIFDKFRTLSLLDSIITESISSNKKDSSQIVDCCIIIKDFINEKDNKRGFLIKTENEIKILAKEVFNNLTYEAEKIKEISSLCDNIGCESTGFELIELSEYIKSSVDEIIFKLSWR